uniref:ATP-dependent DNA helicase n=1 Tax=Octopus bimaculoides TaxID=37653 RepID=A0A0L8GCP2_OCTBM
MFVTRLILAKVRLQKCITIAVETSGIAATLLPGGRTAHSTFKLPLNLSIRQLDTIPNQDEVVDYPNEFLNSLEPSGVPPHILTLKVGSPVMLIRNLNPPKLYNDVFIPRIPFVPSAADLPFTFCRVQFPIRLSYTMSINKTGGQSLSVVRLYFAEPCISHSPL